jgi:hypothetical protein
VRRLDVVAFQVGATGDVGMVVGQPGAEPAQIELDMTDRVRPQTDADLVDVAAVDRLLVSDVLDLACGRRSTRGSVVVEGSRNPRRW